MSNSLKIILIAAIGLSVACVSSGGGDPTMGRETYILDYFNVPHSGVVTFPAPGYNTTEIGSRAGSACVTREPDLPLFWIVRERGDRSIEAAAKLAGITKIKSVSYTYKSIPQFLGMMSITQVCTNLTGD